MKEIKLTKGYVTQVDDEDFEHLNQWKWFVQIDKNTCYARLSINKNKKWTHHMMHRMIMNAPKHLQVDHIDKNGLNNQRSNLRLCTASQNGSNRISLGRSKYLGVNFYCDKKGKEYIRAAIKSNGKQIYIGTFKTEEDAAMAYNKAALKYHGEFANLNIINYINKK